MEFYSKQSAQCTILKVLKIISYPMYYNTFSVILIIVCKLSYVTEFRGDIVWPLKYDSMISVCILSLALGFFFFFFFF